MPAISAKGATVKQPVPLIQLANVTKDTGVNEIEQLMRKCFLATIALDIAIR